MNDARVLATEEAEGTETVNHGDAKDTEGMKTKNSVSPCLRG